MEQQLLWNEAKQILMNEQFIKGISIDWNRIDRDSYLRKIEAINGLNTLEFTKPITFFVGENGCIGTFIIRLRAILHFIKGSMYYQ